MSTAEVVVQGTLKPDGTLELDAKPDLPPGRVTVILQQHVPTGGSQENWWQCLQRMRVERETSGYPFFREEEAKVYLEELREPDFIDELLAHENDQGQERNPDKPC